MGTETNNQIIQVLNALCEKFGIAVDWSTQNVMPYAQDLMKKMVNYELWTSVSWIVIHTFIILGDILISRFLWKRWKNFRCSDLEFIPTIAWIILGSISLASGFEIIDNITNIITCLTFPEKIILETIQSMMP